MVQPTTHTFKTFNHVLPINLTWSIPLYVYDQIKNTLCSVQHKLYLISTHRSLDHHQVSHTRKQDTSVKFVRSHKFYTFALYRVFTYGISDDGLRTEAYRLWVDIKYRWCWKEHIVLSDVLSATQILLLHRYCFLFAWISKCRKTMYDHPTYFIFRFCRQK
jgi:hypothetical protein